MTFQEIWQQLCRKRPLLSDPDSTVEFKSVNLKSLLRQAYEQGEKAGIESEAKRAFDANQRDKNQPQTTQRNSGPFDFMNDFFNKR